MATPTNDRVAGPYEATGGETLLAYDFKITSADELLVSRRRASVTSELVLDTDFTVTGVGEAAGGNVVLASGADAGDLYVIVGDAPRARNSDISDGKALKASALNGDFDNLQRQVQEIDEMAQRGLRRSRFDGSVGGLELPPFEADTLFGYGASGDVVLFPGLAATTSTVAGYAASAAASDDSAAVHDANAEDSANAAASDRAAVELVAAAIAAYHPARNFDSVADLVADELLTYEAGDTWTVAVGDTIEAGPFEFTVVAAGATAHLATAGGVVVQAAPDEDGEISLLQFGVSYSDRSAAATNGAAINRALAFAGGAGYGLSLGFGVIFNSVPIVQDKRVDVRGGGVTYWVKQYNSTFPPQAPTAIVFTGTGSKDETLFGVSSCRAWGAARSNPSAQAGYNDASYELTSFVEENAAASGRTLKAFSVGWKVEGADAVGSTWRGFRLMPDAGGDDGMDDVRSSDRTVTKPLSSGDWDIGFIIRGVRECAGHHLQGVGQWRMGGLLLAPHVKDWSEGGTLYNTIFRDCTFSRALIRSVDGAPVVATTAATVDIPWADDHPFGADGDLDLILTTGGRAGDAFTYTGMSKVTGGSYDILRFTGVSPDPTGSSYKNCYPGYVGGGTSNVVFDHCEIQGFGHGSLEPSENQDLGGSSLNFFARPLANIEISGNELTEISFPNSGVTGYETIAIHAHDCRNIAYPRYYEMNNGGRLIASPQRASTPYTVHASVPAISETLDVLFEPHGSTITGGELDMRPYITAMTTPPRFSDGADTGFFEPVKLRSQRFGTPALLDIGSFLIAPKGGIAGLGRMVGPWGFFDPAEGDADMALYYDYDDNITRVRKDMISNTANQAALGSSNNVFKSAWASGFLSKEFTIANEAVATFTPQRSGGWLFVTTCSGDSTPLSAFSGLLFFDVGGSLALAKTNLSVGGSSLDTSTSDVTGTTGTPGNITIAVQADTIKIENQSGGSRTVRITVIG